MHACACVRMVHNNEKHSKIVKKEPLYHLHELVGQRLGVSPKSWLTPANWSGCSFGILILQHAHDEKHQKS